METWITLRFDAAEDGALAGPARRLDRFLAAKLHPTSRADLSLLIEEGRVLVDGRPARKGHRLLGGEEIRVPAGEPRAAWKPIPDPKLVLAIHYEDAGLLVVEKPAGIACHPLRPEESGTVANALAAMRPETAGVGAPLEAGLLHRLDTGTSGLLAAAKSPDAHARLREAWGSGAVEKIYLAIVHGDLRTGGRVETPVANSPRSGRKMILARGGARGLSALTEYEPVVAEGGADAGVPAGAPRALTLVRVRIHEGRRHQIRLHLASIGFSVVGDDLYGNSAATRDAYRSLPEGRLGLHAHRLVLPRGSGGGSVTVTSPLPGDLAALVPI